MKMKRVFAILLTLCMVLAIVPAEHVVQTVSAVAMDPDAYLPHVEYSYWMDREGVFSVGAEAGLTKQEVGLYLRFCMLYAYKYFDTSEADHLYASVTYYDSQPADESTAYRFLNEALGYGCYTSGPIDAFVYETEMESDGVYCNSILCEIPHNLAIRAEEVAYTVETVEAIIEELNLDGKSDYEKIRIISQYICDRVTYVNDGGDCYTAYGALKNNQAVCEGYAHLTRALLMEAGIDCVFISGEVQMPSGHAWNIVKLDGLYYNLDTTWCDRDRTGQMDEDWFLRGATDFSGHYRDGRYATDDFHAQHPMAATKYDGTPGTVYSCNGNHDYDIAYPGAVRITPTLTTAGSIVCICSWCSKAELFEMPALNTIDYSYQVETEATCTTRGLAWYKWKVEPIRIGQYLPATGHNYVDGVCTVCGVAGEHNWAEATCTAPKTCTICGATEGSALGHSWKNATCTTAKTCSTCGATEGDPLGHSWKNASCTAAKTCSTCGATEGSALGHNWQDATCDKPMICSVCMASSGRPAGHTYDDGVDGTCNGCGVHREEVETREVVHMFRMYNPNTGEHFYTGSTVERDNLIAAGWQYEGIGFTFPANTGLPVHRLFQPSTGEHLYTMDEAEKDRLMAEGWNYEGIAFNSAYNTEAVQHRLHNPNATVGAYHFTFSLEERDTLIAAGWEYQGIGWYSCWK